MNIRPARTSDISRMMEIDPATEHNPHRPDFLCRAVEAGTCRVAEEEDAVLGFLILDYTFFSNGFVRLLVVDESARRRGIGMALMQDALRHCRTTKLFTSTNVSNVPMQILLTKLGYEVSGLINNIDPGDPEIIYLLNL